MHKSNSFLCTFYERNIQFILNGTSTGATPYPYHNRQSPCLPRIPYSIHQYLLIVQKYIAFSIVTPCNYTSLYSDNSHFIETLAPFLLEYISYTKAPFNTEHQPQRRRQHWLHCCSIHRTSTRHFGRHPQEPSRRLPRQISGRLHLCRRWGTTYHGLPPLRHNRRPHCDNINTSSNQAI